jgi:SAM-dependent methyltransferase
VNSDEKMSPREIYRRRFEASVPYRRALWAVLCRDFFQRYVDPSAAILEVGAGYCEFSNAIRADRKTALDINPDVRSHAAPDVRAIIGSALDMTAIERSSQDVVFMSNFLEHLTRQEILTVLRECARVLRPGGRLLILQPNIRYSWRDYWMFLDHVTAIDDRALCEALELNGYRIERCISRFLPYSTVSRFPKALFLVRIYLRVPLLWRMFGKQSLVVAEKADARGLKTC